MRDSTRPEQIERFDLRVKVALLAVSLGTIALLAVASWKENFRAEWRLHQLRHSEYLLVEARNDREQKIAEDFRIELRQLVVPDLGLVDRCISCHVGVEDVRMADRPQPSRSHPGDWLVIHEPARFGCTSCHGGQGRATERDAAHGHVAHWEEPLIEKRFLGSVCARCHGETDLFGEGGGLASAGGGTSTEAVRSLALRGRELVFEKGCLGCHAYRGRGGTLGPNLTLVGEKTRHDYDFSHFGPHEPRTVVAWLEKHFREPQAVSPGSLMPPLDVDAADTEALVAYMLSLRERNAPASHLAAASDGAARPTTGDELWGLFCAACHGADGRQGNVPGIRTPALNNPDFLAVADDDYLRSNVARGRSGTKMPAWGHEAGLSREEIDRLVAHIRAWEPTGPDLRGVSAARGSEARGRSIYAGLCRNCHGAEGEGGIGNRLASATFLAVASDAFLAETIVHGRPGTAMPSWKELDAQDVSDLLAHLRSWHRRDHDRSTVVALSTSLDRAVEIGRATFRSQCAPCHGAEGEGGIGVNLSSQDFLARVSRDYLFDAIVEGRPGTAMPSWSHLTSEQIAALIAFLDSWQTRPDVPVDGPMPRGNWQLGEVVYAQACASCHGTRGQGGVGPQIANPTFLRSATDRMLFDWIGHGKSGTAMKGFLPEAQGVVTVRPEQIRDVIAFLRYVGAQGDLPVAREGTGDAVVGEEIWVGSCAPCHGRIGEGASGPQLANPSFLATVTDGFLAATIVLGRTDTAMRSMVHGREGLGQIRPRDVDDVIAWVRQWSTPWTWRVPRPAVEMTQEAIDSGRRAFARYCAGCHGPEGRGVLDGEDFFAPTLHAPEFLQGASDGFLLATIARGRRGTPMRAFGRGAGGIAELDGRTIEDIVSYVRSWAHDEVDVVAGGESAPDELAGGGR